MTPEELLELAKIAVEACPADQAEALAFYEAGSVTRFARNTVHQSMAVTDTEISVRAVIGKRVAVAAGVLRDRDDAVRVAKQAAELAKVAAELPDFKSLPEPKPIPEVPERLDRRIVEILPAERTELAGAAIELARERGLQAAGALSLELTGFAVANSLGVEAARQTTLAHFHVVMQAEDSAGYAELTAWKLEHLPIEKLAEKAAAKALNGRHPRELQPGRWTVVLEPSAAAELFSEVGMFGFNALAVQEQRSFLCDWRGKKAGSELLTLREDAYDRRTLYCSFDYEGVPKQPVVLIDRGVIGEPVYDSYTAGREDPPRESTGHALPAPNSWGPVPLNMVIEPGEQTMEQLISSLDRAILVTRIHYLNVVHPRRLVLTGMTREGTFLIENGEIACGVKNFRFEQNMVEAMANVVAVGRDGELHGAIWTPPLVIEGFNFTSTTEF